MATFPQTGGILYFSVGFGTVGSGKSFNRFSSGGNFASQDVLPTGRKMTLLTGNLFMARAFPAGNIRLHKMARIAEPGGVAVKKEKPTKRSYDPKDQQQYDNAESAG